MNESNRVAAIDAFSIHIGYIGFPMKSDGSNLNEILVNFYKLFPN